MRVLALTLYDSIAASTRYRFELFQPGLRRSGIEVEVRPLLDDAYFRARYVSRWRTAPTVLAGYARRLKELLLGEQPNLFWIHSELFPFLPMDADCLPARLEVPYVIDLDDANFHKYDLSPYSVVRALLGGKFERLLTRAAAVTAGGEYLVAYARRFSSEVAFAPTVVDTDATPFSLRTAREPLVIGWIGSPTNTKYLELLREPIERLSQERSFRFVVVGGAPLQWKGVNLDQREWTLATEKADLNEMDVGVMPLVDTPWTRGKCGFKLIQYMASGACAVASPVGANLAILTSETGCFAETPADWLRTLRDLLDDGSLRARLARSARSRVEREFSLARWLPTIAGVLQNAATAKGA